MNPVANDARRWQRPAAMHSQTPCSGRIGQERPEAHHVWAWLPLTSVADSDQGLCSGHQGATASVMASVAREVKWSCSVSQAPTRTSPGTAAPQFLVMASVAGHVEVVHILCGSGANKDHANHQGATALAVALVAGKVEVLCVLFGAGANENIQTTRAPQPWSWRQGPAGCPSCGQMFSHYCTGEDSDSPSCGRTSGQDTVERSSHAAPSGLAAARTPTDSPWRGQT